MFKFAEDNSSESHRKLLESLKAKQRQLEAQVQMQSEEVRTSIYLYCPFLVADAQL